MSLLPPPLASGISWLGISDPAAAAAAAAQLAAEDAAADAEAAGAAPSAAAAAPGLRRLDGGGGADADMADAAEQAGLSERRHGGIGVSRLQQLRDVARVAAERRSSSRGGAAPMDAEAEGGGRRPAIGLMTPNETAAQVQCCLHPLCRIASHCIGPKQNAQKLARRSCINMHQAKSIHNFGRSKAGQEGEEEGAKTGTACCAGGQGAWCSCSS